MGEVSEALEMENPLPSTGRVLRFLLYPIVKLGKWVSFKVHVWYTYLRRADIGDMEEVCAPTEGSILLSIL